MIKMILCDMADIPIEEDYERLLAGLGEKERAEVCRFRQLEDRYRALIRQGLLSFALHEMFPGREVALEKNEYGKPMIKRSGKDTALDVGREHDFNISHSGRLVVICFGRGPVGVDVERWERIKDIDRMLRFFSEEEQRRIKTASDPKKEFIRIWTFREAFSKEEGVGLSLFEKEPVEIDYDNASVLFRGRTLVFREFLYPDYQLTVCVEKDEETIEMVKVDAGMWKNGIWGDKKCVVDLMAEGDA